MGRGVGVGRTVAEGVGVGVTIGVGLAVGVGVAPPAGAWIAIVIGDPVLKKSIMALVACGGWSASNRKLYSVPQRIAFAFWFCANVSQFHVSELEVWTGVHGVPL